MIFNDRLDAAVAAFFMVSVVIIIAERHASGSPWSAGSKPCVTTEVPVHAARTRPP